MAEYRLLAAKTDAIRVRASETSVPEPHEARRRANPNCVGFCGGSKAPLKTGNHTRLCRVRVKAIGAEYNASNQKHFKNDCGVGKTGIHHGILSISVYTGKKCSANVVFLQLCF